MQRDPSRATTELYRGVLVLAAGAGTIEQRLGEAFHAHLGRVSASALPPDMHDEWNAIQEELLAMYPAPGRTHRVDFERSSELARRIILIYDALIR